MQVCQCVRPVDSSRASAVQWSGNIVNNFDLSFWTSSYCWVCALGRYAPPVLPLMGRLKMRESFIHSFIHFWHAPLWLHSTKRRHHSPEWTILSHINCFIQGEVQWFQKNSGPSRGAKCGLENVGPNESSWKRRLDNTGPSYGLKNSTGKHRTIMQWSGKCEISCYGTPKLQEKPKRQDICCTMNNVQALLMYTLT